MNGTLRDGKPGIYYTTNYSMVGANAVGQQVIMDGLNDQGLSFGLFYFPGFAEYPAPSAPWPSPRAKSKPRTPMKPCSRPSTFSISLTFRSARCARNPTTGWT
jgi:hypothetical protein